MPRVVHFEIAADNMERAAEFYEQVFGWTFQKWSGPQEYWLITTGPDSQPGIGGGLMRRRPGQHALNTIAVASLEDSIRAIEAKGGTITSPKRAIPGIGWLAHFQDPEGNGFALLEPDASAC